jgi:hypothetical protein
MADFNKHFSRKNIPKEQTLMLHGVGFVTGDPTIRIGYPFIMHPGVQVSSTEVGDNKWIYMMLPIPKWSLITQVAIAYKKTGIHNYLSLIRLVEQREPVSATVVHNEIIEKTIPSSCIISAACHVVVRKSILLKVCMEFNNEEDLIEFGSVEVRYIPEYESSVPEEVKDRREKNFLQMLSSEKQLS